ncbi:unnamed protein product, partial [Urochloa humidicola]
LKRLLSVSTTARHRHRRSPRLRRRLLTAGGQQAPPAAGSQPLDPPPARPPLDPGGARRVGPACTPPPESDAGARLRTAAGALGMPRAAGRHARAAVDGRSSFCTIGRGCKCGSRRPVANLGRQLQVLPLTFGDPCCARDLSMRIGWRTPAGSCPELWNSLEISSSSCARCPSIPTPYSIPCVEFAQIPTPLRYSSPES